RMALLMICGAIILTWLVVATVLVGIGSLLLRSFGAEHSPPQALWVGLGGAVAIAEIYNFFWPIDSFFTILISSLGLIGLVIAWRPWLHRRSRLGASNLWMVFASMTIVVVAFRAAGPCIHYDTGLYGATMVRWILTHPVVPGLANLHVRLG